MPPDVTAGAAAADLSGRVALVTGGASGIGAAVCRLLAGRGARVTVVDVDEGAGQAVAAAAGGLFVRADVGDPAALEAAVAATTDRWGRLDLAGLNAGTASRPDTTGLEPLDLDGYRRVVGVNLDGAVFGVAAVLPAMRAAGGGSIVVTASLAGLVPMPSDPFYTLTKTAVVALVRALAPTLAPHIRVNALCPGFADTPLLAPIRDRLTGAGFPLLSAERVAEEFLAVAADSGSGQAWFVQPGRPAAPYEFRGVPGPRTGDGPAPVPPALTEESGR